MTVGQKLLRYFFPEDEYQRQEMRKTIACASAHAEDLSRTTILHADHIKWAIEREQRK